MQFSFLLTVLAFVAHLAYAIPYACLLAGVNTQDNPADLPAVCGKGATTVQRYLASNCGGNVNDAQKAFIATCSAAGTSVAAYTASSTSSGSSSGATTMSRSSTNSASSSGSVTSTGSAGSITAGARTSGSTATSSAGSAISTGAANLDYRAHAKMGPAAAAAIALMGAVAAL